MKDRETDIDKWINRENKCKESEEEKEIERGRKIQTDRLKQKKDSKGERKRELERSCKFGCTITKVDFTS